MTVENEWRAKASAFSTFCIIANLINSISFHIRHFIVRTYNIKSRAHKDFRKTLSTVYFGALLYLPPAFFENNNNNNNEKQKNRISDAYET